ncbi:MAG: circularly permuted type 2 ATP-grasp protein [Burkholderiales bacterium]|nr:circularly permuted type 2 ATP-grasp protein [Burkholderiales bacterium]
MLAAGGTPRPHWDAFLRALAARAGAEVGDTLSLMEREIRENGITYNVYADPKGADRPWEVDPLPLLLSAAEWEGIEAGIVQRAELLNRVLGDIYGAQTLLRSGAIPAPVIFGHSGYQRAAHGIRPAGGVHLFQYAADLARSPDGRWWVVADRTQAPSGAGYALENRLVVSRVFPQMFADLNVQHLASFFAGLRDSLLHWAPKPAAGDGAPRVVLLTPGPYNETYFEHALIARYLGFALVEGSDLTVRDGCVWMKTVEGLQRVHAILRRQDDDYCDPLELRSDSALGVAGLTDCARRGTVFIGNALGSGVIESGALLGYLPQLCEQLLGEPLRLPSIATWWLGEPAAFDDAWKRLDKLLIKPLERSAREPALFGADLSTDERTVLRAHVAARPQRFVAQEWVHLSQAPVLERRDGRPAPGGEVLAPRAVGLRVFAVATPDGYRVMPGGLTRVAGAGESRAIAMQRGGRSKDTWVLSSAPVNASFSLLSTTVRAEDLVASRANLPSRAAENLFWYGRYSERCDCAARALRVAIAGVLDPVAGHTDGLAPAIVLAHRLALIDSTDDADAALLRAATHPEAALAQRLRQLSRAAFNLRDRMSADNWRTLNRLAADPVFRRGASASVRLPVALSWLDRAVTAMMTLSGFALDGMTRNAGWRFLSIGRRIERLANLSMTLQVATTEGRVHGIDWLLELTDSIGTYRSRYLVAPEWLPVLDLLLRDETNPRSVAFQLKGLAEYIDRLELGHGRFASDVLAPAHAALRDLNALDLDPESPALAQLLEQLRRCASAVSDELSLKFFSHAQSRSVLSLVA